MIQRSPDRRNGPKGRKGGQLGKHDAHTMRQESSREWYPQTEDESVNKKLSCDWFIDSNVFAEYTTARDRAVRAQHGSQREGGERMTRIGTETNGTLHTQQNKKKSQTRQDRTETTDEKQNRHVRNPNTPTSFVRKRRRLFGQISNI